MVKRSSLLGARRRPLASGGIIQPGGVTIIGNGPEFGGPPFGGLGASLMMREAVASVALDRDSRARTQRMG